jgi:hypothetical protein
MSNTTATPAPLNTAPPDLDGRKFDRRNTMAIVGAAVSALIATGILATFMTTDLGSRGVPPVKPGTFADDPLFGFAHWALLFETGSMVMFGVTLTVLATNCIEARRVTTGTLFFAAAMVLYVLDPIGNWAPYAVYDPQMLHWPVDWPWAAIAPNVEPVAGFFGYFGFYVGIPVLCVQIVQKYLRPRGRQGSFVNRRPVITLMLVTVVVGFVLDAIIEIFMIRTGVLTYLQVVPFGSLWVGTRHQFPLLWQSLFTTIPFLAGALLWWRGSSGLSTAELPSMIWSPMRRLGRFGTFLVVAVGLMLGYLAFLTPYVIIHKTGWATGTAQPYLFCDSVVPDPNGLMRLNGQPGPYLDGWWPGPYLTEATHDGPAPQNGCPHP